MFHISLLRHFQPDEAQNHTDPELVEPEIELIPEDDEYEVEAILDKRIVCR